MAVDTKAKRFSMLSFGRRGHVLPAADGSFGQGDRLNLLGLYSGGTPAPTPTPSAGQTVAYGGGFLLDPTWGQPRQPKRERKKRRKEFVRSLKPVALPDPWENEEAARLAAQIEEEDLMLLGICDGVNLFE